MAWNISISADGWAGLRAALEAKPREWLIKALTDDRFEQVEQASGSAEHASRAADALRKRLEETGDDGVPYASIEALANDAYEALERNDTCDNGGFLYWVDREGYHKVSPFDRCDAGLVSECTGYFDPDDAPWHDDRYTGERVCPVCRDEHISSEQDEMRGYIVASAARALWVSWYARQAEQEICSSCENRYPLEPLRDCQMCAWHQRLEEAGAGEDWMDVAPDTPADAMEAAEAFIASLELANSIRIPRFSDGRLRKLEREAATGDPQAAEALAQEYTPAHIGRWFLELEGIDPFKDADEETAEAFGFAISMEAQGTGVSWEDDHPPHKLEGIAHQLEQWEHASRIGDVSVLPPNPADIQAAIRGEDGMLPAYAWPGGYPIRYLTADSGELCPDCANGENGSEASALEGTEGGWFIIGHFVAWEGEPSTCDHCETMMETAYGNPDGFDCSRCGNQSDWTEPGDGHCGGCDEPFCQECTRTLTAHGGMHQCPDEAENTEGDETPESEDDDV